MSGHSSLCIACVLVPTLHWVANMLHGGGGGHLVAICSGLSHLAPFCSYQTRWTPSKRLPSRNCSRSPPAHGHIINVFNIQRNIQRASKREVTTWCRWYVLWALCLPKHYMAQTVHIRLMYPHQRSQELSQSSLQLELVSSKLLRVFTPKAQTFEHVFCNASGP